MIHMLSLKVLQGVATQGSGITYAAFLFRSMFVEERDGSSLDKAFKRRPPSY